MNCEYRKDVRKDAGLGGVSCVHIGGGLEGVQVEVLERVPHDCCTSVFLEVVD